jgi:hypothetical protein
MFVASKQITNTEHTKDAHLLLRRLIVYIHYILVKHGLEPTTPHVPNVSTFDGTIDLFMLCVIMELGDLINPSAYKKKKYRRNWDRDSERLCTIYARGLARELCKWWCANYSFYDPVANAPVGGESVFDTILTQHIHALVSYKRLAEKKNIHGDELECTAEVLAGLLEKYFPNKLASCGSGGDFEWLGPTYMVQSRPEGIISYSSGCKSSNLVLLHPFTMKWIGQDIFKLGATTFDQDFIWEYINLVVDMESDGLDGDSNEGGHMSDGDNHGKCLFMVLVICSSVSSCRSPTQTPSVRCVKCHYWDPAMFFLILSFATRGVCDPDMLKFILSLHFILLCHLILHVMYFV